LHRFRLRADRVLDAFCLSRGAIATIPALTIHPVEARLGRTRSLTANREAAAMLTPAQLAVTINLYLVKRRRHGGFAAAGDSVPGPLTTFRLGKGKRWRASRRVWPGCRWSCWPYSQPRTGVVNRLPGIVSDRIPLAFTFPSHLTSLGFCERKKQNGETQICRKEYVSELRNVSSSATYRRDSS
jgi:hypothetical protein